MNIYVGNLSYDVRDEELRAIFEPFGQIVAAEVIFDKRTRRSRGYGFVQMANDSEAQQAIETLNGKEVHGRELRVDASQPRSEKPLTRGDSERAPRAPRPPRPSPAASQTAAAEAGTGVKGFFKRLFG